MDGKSNLDTVRGLACVLLVAYHVVGESVKTGLRLPPDSSWHYAMESFVFLRMPIFTILSGYLYALHRVELAAFARFWAKKARRIVIPLLFATVVMWVLQGLMGEEKNIIRAIFWNYLHLWYLQALLIIFLAASLLDAFVRPGPRRLAILIAGLSLLSATTYFIAPKFFSLHGAIYLAPFFFFGILLQTAPGLLRRRDVLVVSAVVTVAALVIQQVALMGYLPHIDKNNLLATACGMAGATLLLRFFPPVSGLALVGRYSYTIYLWHILPAAAVRMVLLRLGVDETWMLFVACFIAGLAGPIVAHLVASRIPYVSVAVTGNTAKSLRKTPRPAMA